MRRPGVLLSLVLLLWLLQATVLAEEHPLAAPTVGGTGSELDYPLVVGTLDGSLHAISRATGEGLWVLNGGPLLQGTIAADGRSSTTPLIYLPDPRDGSLYVARKGVKGLQRVGRSIQDLVQASPFAAEDGSVYLGSKTTRVYSMNARTGELHNKYLPETNDEDETTHHQAQLTARDPTLFIGRTQYTVTIHARATSMIQWNLTLAEYSHPYAALSHQEFARESRYFGEVDIIAEGGLQYLVFENKAQGASWRRAFVDPIVALYRAGPGGALQRLPLACRPDEIYGLRTSTSIPTTDTLAGDSVAEWTLLRVAKTSDGLLYAAGNNLLLDKAMTAALLATPTATGVRQLPGTALAVAWFDHAEPLSTTEEADFPESLLGDHILALPPPADSSLPADVAGWPGDAPRISQEIPTASERPTSVTIVLSAAVGLLASGVLVMWWRWHNRSTDTNTSSGVAVHVAAEQVDSDHSDQTLLTPAASLQYPLTIGKLVVHDTILGHGSLGTIVYKGQFEGQGIAIKRVLTEYVEVALREVELLRQSDDHPNVVRYFTMEQDSAFLYIGLELCLGSLVQVVEGPSISTRGTHHGAVIDPARLVRLDRLALARDFLSGIAHLHQLNIVHRDIKPQNILLSTKYRAMVTDFGLCKHLRNQQSFATGDVGTIGWTAPEILKNNRLTKSVDVFSAGCVLHYLVYGSHPFGPHYERESNIRRGSRQLQQGDSALDHLIQRMIRHRYQDRGKIEQALSHPVFWPAAKRLSFLTDVSDRVENEKPEHPLVVALEKHADKVVGLDWMPRLDTDLRADMGRFRTYKSNSLVDLLRVVRNKKHHYRELSDSLKKALGPVPDSFTEYFLSRFPRLLIHVFCAVSNGPCKDEPMFAHYFVPSDKS